MKTVFYQMGKVLLFLLPLVLGMIGLWVLGEVPLLDALFSCINMYVLIGGLVLGYIWQFVFSRVFVGIGEATGWSLFESSWLSDPNLAFAALVLVSVWQLSGYMILIYVAGFMGLNQDVMEAASIDGATGWTKLRHIILPLMQLF